MRHPVVRALKMTTSTARESPRYYPATFRGGMRGLWQVERMKRVRGTALPSVPWVEVLPTLERELPSGFVWSLRGITEEEHYTRPAEQERLRAVQPELGRPTSTRAALIPIRKSEAWWDLPLTARRAIFEERSHHIASGLEYLPAVARRLYHGRSLGEPFDFLTWFEFTPK